MNDLLKKTTEKVYFHSLNGIEKTGGNGVSKTQSFPDGNPDGKLL